MTRHFLVLFGALTLMACEPKFSEVSISGAPVCPNSRLSTEVVLKIEGPRASVMQRLNGTQQAIAAKLEQGKTYDVKAFRCTAEPCEAPANLFYEQKLTAPSTPTGEVSIALKNAPECVAVAPPPAPPAPAAAEDAGAP